METLSTLLGSDYLVPNILRNPGSLINERSSMNNIITSQILNPLGTTQKTTRTHQAAMASSLTASPDQAAYVPDYPFTALPPAPDCPVPDDLMPDDKPGLVGGPTVENCFCPPLDALENKPGCPCCQCRVNRREMTHDRYLILHPLEGVTEARQEAPEKWWVSIFPTSVEL
jgi:hypothetical protein